MSFKTLCVYEGLGIWSAAYPPIEEQDTSQLTSGLLSAITLFAKHTEGQDIKSMIIGDHDWTFAEIGENDRGFFVLQIPVINKNIPGLFETELSTVIILNLREEFLRRYPLAAFQHRIDQGLMFSEFEPVAEEILKKYYAFHERRQALDLKWLLTIKDCEKLITAAMEKQHIDFLTERDVDPQVNDTTRKVLAIIEFFSNSINVNVGFIDDMDKLDENAADPQTIRTLVSLASLSVVQGPDPSLFASRLVEYINTTTDAKIKDLIENFEGFHQQVVNNINFNKLDELSSKGTSFECGLCNQLVKFDIGNKASFITRSAPEKFFGKELSTYKIPHFAGNEIHINEVLVDQAGIMEKIVDSYILNIKDYNSFSPEKHDFHILTKAQGLLNEESKIALFIIYNKLNHWIFEVQCPAGFKCEEIAHLVQDKLQEQERVMKIPSPYFTFDIGNNTLHVWTSGELVLCSIIEDRKLFNAFNAFVKQFLDHTYYGEELIERRERLALALKIIESKDSVSSDINSLIRIVFDDTITAPIKLKYAQLIPQITTRIESEFPIARSILEPFLTGKITLLEAIEKNNITKVDEIFELLDFINRRELIT